LFSTTARYGNVGKGLVLLLGVVILGTAGFVVMEGFSFLDALYMTVITVSTVGYGEVRSLDTSGRIFDILLIVSGLAVMTYTLGALGAVLIEGSIQRFVGRQRMLREIEALTGHYIVCGHGRMGQILCEELREEKVPFVIVEKDHDVAEELVGQGRLVVNGDATEDAILDQAGIKRARGLVAVVSSDVDNLYITLSAREMCRQDNSGLYILARATDHRATTKITRAGADRVISPYAIGGMRMVQALLRPTVGLDLMFEELTIGDGSSMAEVEIKHSGIRERFNVIIIAVKKTTGQMVFNPGPDYFLEGDDVLITLGNRDQLRALGKALA
jgi:voltage-gated potassium channel